MDGVGYGYLLHTEACLMGSPSHPRPGQARLGGPLFLPIEPTIGEAMILSGHPRGLRTKAMVV